METDVIYLDYNATTPIDPAVVEVMLPFITTHFGNPSSSHVFGSAARQAVEKARAQIAAMLGCESSEIIFTSGGTEANNLAIRGFAQAHRSIGNHVITSAVEHPAVLEVCRDLQQSGFDLTILPVDEYGRVSVSDLEAAINEGTILISIMHANNEVGTIQPIERISEIAHSHNIAFHTDAAQSIGKVPVNVCDLGVDLLSVAGHKLYAPKGIGALYINKGTELNKQNHGASHERNLRPGTENVIGIVGLGKACELIAQNLSEYAAHYEAMRDLLESKLQESKINFLINGDLDHRLPNTSSLSFKSVRADKLISDLTGVAASAGAACHAEDVSISQVLVAMGVSEDFAAGTIRISTGRNTMVDDIRDAAEMMIQAVQTYT